MINIEKGAILTVRQQKMQFKGWDTYCGETTAEFRPIEYPHQSNYISIRELEEILSTNKAE